MKKVFILLGATLLAGSAFGEVLSNGPTNGATVYSCTSVPIEMVFVKGGTLANSGGTSIAVSDFYIGKYEVTQKQWLDVTGSISPSKTYFGDNYPMSSVNWDDTQEFIVKLNAMVGGNGFRLPTEAEWEYAARGGSSPQGFAYAGSNTANDVAWYRGNSNSKAHVVGEKNKANGIGAYDMSGNVWEWCKDWFGGSSGENPIPVPFTSSGTTRVVRGGSWNDDETSSTVSYRGVGSPNNRSGNLGFRLAYSSNP
jgi:formylglycine-generating enzyme required for sulfatase activity